MNASDWTYEAYIEDVQHLINLESPKSLTHRGNFDWTRYYTLEEMYAWLDTLEAQHPNNVTKDPGVFIEGGIHAREWISPATVTYLLNEILTSNQTEVRKLAESYDWYIVPLFNPEGYVYTHTTDRYWRKTLSPNSNSACNGTDLNRNWDFKCTSSDNPCFDTYSGKSAFSEIEVKTISKYIKSIGDKLFAYLSFHRYSQCLVFLYGYTEDHIGNYNESYAIAKESVKALYERYRTKYRIGNIAETIYKARGTSLDWVKNELKLPVTFGYELRDTGRYGFLLPAYEIIPTSLEVLDSLVAMFEESEKFGYP